ncbi:helix-turn-helix domain-containing protein [Streptococcus orisratti]|uniref:helix-turn-helix domain-containing protein n=1 Tax=Streptococcus orisratti TaxID=114652 RepID=UPI003B5B95D0
MSKRSPKSVSEKLEIVLLHLEEGKSLSWLTRNQGISKDTLSNWVRKYKEAGVEGLEESRQWKKYKTFEELVSDIDDYIYFYNHQRFQERNNGLAPLEMRNKAVA